MENNNLLIGPEDYAEPRCLLCGDDFGTSDEAIRSIDQRRVAEKLDEYTDRRDYAGAEHHLLYWLEEAKLGHDLRGEFMLRNELMGFYRKQNRRDEAFENADRALAIIHELGSEENISSATCYINSATVYDAFGEAARSIALFEQAKQIYLRQLPENDARLGGLYNNMALALTALRRFGEAYECYRHALDVMSRADHGALEQAITYLNMANAVEDEHGLEKAAEKIDQYLGIAENLLNDTSLVRNGYYAFVCEKCAPTFDYYGWFVLAADLKERAEKIYAGA